MKRIAICYVVHDDASFLKYSIESFRAAGTPIAFVSRVGWDDSVGPWEETVRVCEEANVEVVVGVWNGETVHRQSAYKELVERGFDYIITADSDEIIEPALRDALVEIAERDFADRVYIHWDTYWKDTSHVVRPREPFTPHIMFNPHKAWHTRVREYEGGRQLLLPDTYGIIHHLSYAGTDARIKRKTESWGHKDEVLEGWFDQVWKAWDNDHLLRNVHPTHPGNYASIEAISTPSILANIDCGRPGAEPLAPPKKKRKLSVVIPLYGGVDEIRQCLSGVTKCSDVILEVLVVDNCSPDDAADVAESFDGVKVIRLSENRGFAAACNVGYEGSKGDAVMFLNSDAVVSRAGVIRLLETLYSSGTIAAVGPFTNNSIGPQKIEPTYTSLENLDLFADEFAHREVTDFDVDFLVGFCFVAKKTALDDVGTPFDERFGLGMYEDNDLSYRLRREGYRLVVCGRAYVHHTGSSTIRREGIDARKLLVEGKKKIRDKWRADLDLGFASHISGMGHGPIVWNKERKPEKLYEEWRAMAKKAKVSLCIIARNEERVLADCLRSAAPFCTQIIVVDTGSSDRTREIAKEFGAELYDFKWCDSFSAARNESLKYATGRWILWLDADDTLPWRSGEAILRAIQEAPTEVGAFIIPVQFVDAGPAAGTRVDHVKLFRNQPGIKFVRRIHEQILPSIREVGLGIARCPDALVLHSGYDTSEEGQRRKRVRDWGLLDLELTENPDDAYTLFCAGMTAHFSGEHDRGLGFLNRAIEECHAKGDSPIRKAYGLRVEALRALGRQEEALEAAIDGLRRIGHDPDLHFLSGSILANLKRFEEAVQHYQEMERPFDDHFTSYDVGILGHKLWHNAAVAYLELGNYAEARKNLLRAIDSAQQRISMDTLFTAALLYSDLTTANSLLDMVRQREGISERWCGLYAQYSDRVGGAGAGENALVEIARLNAGNAAPRVALCRIMIGTGRRAAAERHLAQMAEAGVPEAAFYLGMEAMQAGALPAALRWMELAGKLNPGHEDTEAQVQQLRAATREAAAKSGDA